MKLIREVYLFMKVINAGNDNWIKEAADNIKAKMSWVSEKSKEKIPYTTVGGEHDNKLIDKPGWWTNGFWGGMMWQMYGVTREDKYLKIARFSEKYFDKLFDDYLELSHDVGFLWLPTAVTDYRITGNEESRKRGLHAANILAGRYNPQGQFIRAWNTQKKVFGGDDTNGWAIIDCMMNIPLLYWADEQINDFRYLNVAKSHADMAMKYFIREDGSVKHIIEFNPETGEYVKSYAGQGYSHGSSWTRGQAWAIYGFALSFRHTKAQKYLETARKVADYFIEAMKEWEYVPVDFRQPENPTWEDSTAAVIAACGMLEIASHMTDAEAGQRYSDFAKALLHLIYQDRCDFTKENDCIVQKCTASYGEPAHEYNIIYGDYYFMEAIFRLNGIETNIW